MLSDNELNAIRDLVAKYEALSDRDRHRYQETEVRNIFIDPLFAALGWPMDNRGHVERETTVSEGKRPDYIFKLNGVPHLFLEAKRFTEDPRALQWAADAITKAYNKGVGWAAVTNFTDLVVYDAYELLIKESRPHKVLDLHYERYFDPDSSLHELSPHSLAERLMEKRAQEAGIRTKTIPIEKRLYESMREWREKLINGMAQYQNWKTEAEYGVADEAVQRLIDRLIFLRNCEDRGVMDPELRSLLHRIRDRGRRNVRVTDSLLRLFAWAANTFDSEIFQTDALIDVQFRSLAHITDFDELLADVIGGLYSVPQSLAEYDFSQMEPDVLGEVYEQYLGYVPQRVRKLAAQQPLPGMPAPEITVEAKRQRRKERGIYYTPRWVVQYIVQQTLGRFLDDHRDRPDAIDNVTILDPACGSGSFLIRAYETLLEHHAARLGGDVGHLDTHTRERVLRNIFGVDLDPQAVEIARLNLLIRMVRQQELLPELAPNIKWGNSLIEGGEAELRPYFADRWEEKRPFNWQREFPDIMEAGGFDIVIGNPPYVRIQTLPRDEVAYYNERYDAATGNYDIYCLLVERGLQLLRPGGLLGFIIPNKFMQAAYGKGLRKLLADSRCVSKIVDFGDAQIFESGTNYTCLLFAAKKPQMSVTYVPAADYLRASADKPNVPEIERLAFSAPAQSDNRSWVFPAPSHLRLLSKLQDGPKLADITHGIFQGVITGADRVFILHLLSVDQASGIATVQSDATGHQHQIEQSILRPMVKGSRHVHPYEIDSTDLILLFPYTADDDTVRLLTQQEMSSLYPKAWDYLNLPTNRHRLESREEGKWRGPSWYGYSRIQNMLEFQKPKLLVPYMVDRVRAAYDASGGLYMVNVTTGGYGIALNRPVLYPFVLAVLNSALAHFYLRRTATRHAGNYYGCTNAALGALPLPRVDLPTLTSDKRHDQLVALVRRMLDLHQRLAAKGTVRDAEREVIEREIDQTDRQIDDLVYDLYHLTAKERALIESEVRR